MSSAAMESLDQGLDLVAYQLQVWVVPSASGLGFGARLTVRRTPTLNVVFEDESKREETGWAQPQEALAAALERGRQFIRIDSLGRAVKAAQDPSAGGSS